MTEDEFKRWLAESGFTGLDATLPSAITPLMHAARHDAL
jgi:hypothetical protein